MLPGDSYLGIIFALYFSIFSWKNIFHIKIHKNDVKFAPSSCTYQLPILFCLESFLCLYFFKEVLVKSSLVFIDVETKNMWKKFYSSAYAMFADSAICSSSAGLEVANQSSRCCFWIILPIKFSNMPSSLTKCPSQVDTQQYRVPCPEMKLRALF